MSSHFSAPPAPSSPPPPSGLPGDYGVTRLVLMPRDPQWLHSYWEVAPYTWTEVERAFGPRAGAEGRPVLRFFPAGGSAGAFDIPVDLAGRNWYVRLPREGGAWQAQLGLVLPDGRFAVLAISNVVHLPAGRASDLIDERWALLMSEWEHLYELSGSGRLGAGSLDLTRSLAKRLELFRSISSWPGGIPSPASGGGGTQG